MIPLCLDSPGTRDERVLRALLEGPAGPEQVASRVTLHPDPTHNYQHVRDSLRRLRAKRLVTRCVPAVREPTGLHHYRLSLTRSGLARARLVAVCPGAQSAGCIAMAATDAMSAAVEACRAAGLDPTKVLRAILNKG